MTKMKRLLIRYVAEHGSNPIHYTHVERFINTVMKLAWERDPLPPEET